jgi:cytochrome c peroxidase
MTGWRCFGFGALLAIMATLPVPCLSGDMDAFRRPSTVPFPVNNPYSADKAALGKALFFDPRVSGEGNMTCMSCHSPSFAWSDGRNRALGALAKQLPRHSPSILNAAWGKLFFWDGRADSLETQALGPITAPMEMNMPMDQLVKRLKALEGYRVWFDRVFPGEGITTATIPRAIATYERTIVSGIAPFDRWVEGDENAVSASAKRGFALFTGKAGCAACHKGWNFTDDEFHDIGLPDADIGRQKLVPNDPRAAHAFKTPSLRSVAQRAPFMHDGSLDSLEAVIAHYVAGGTSTRSSLSPLIKPFVLEGDDMDDLIAFLNSLTGHETATSLPILPK